MKVWLNRYSSLLALLLILLLAAFLRLSGLLNTPASLFSDEVDLGYQVKSLLSTSRDYYGNFLPLQFHSFSDFRTSLPIYATALVSLIPIVSLDLAIRLTPALFSLLSIFLIFFFTNSLYKIYAVNPKIKSPLRPGLWSALTLSLLPWHFTYSRTGFEVSLLLCFLIAGLLFYNLFALSNSRLYLFLSLLTLSLLPAIYSTGKLQIFFIPFLLLLTFYSRHRSTGLKTNLWLIYLFLPLAFIMLDGGAGKRFGEIAIYSDPTLTSETNLSRKLDLGPNPQVGSSPNFLSQIAHNKPLQVLQTLVRNTLNPISLNYLFLQGDTNSRHAVQGWGMLQKMFITPLFIGIFYLLTRHHQRFLFFNLLLLAAAILPSALTRGGEMHSTRLFLMILPLTLFITVGFEYLIDKSKITLFLFICLLFFESFLYFHEYWLHYRYGSEKDFHAGLKEVVDLTQKHSDKTVIISRRYEPPLIFYLYYSDFPPHRFQPLAQSDRFLIDTLPEENLEGRRFTQAAVYFASLKDQGKKNPFKINNAIYYLTAPEMKEIFGSGVALPAPAVTLPSGEGLYYEVAVP